MSCGTWGAGSSSGLKPVQGCAEAHHSVASSSSAPRPAQQQRRHACMCGLCGTSRPPWPPPRLQLWRQRRAVWWRGLCGGACGHADAHRQGVVPGGLPGGTGCLVQRAGRAQRAWSWVAGLHSMLSTMARALAARHRSRCAAPPAAPLLLPPASCRARPTRCASMPGCSATSRTATWRTL